MDQKKEESLVDRCLFKPKLAEPENSPKCYGCIWIEYGCDLYEPVKRPQQLDLFKGCEYEVNR